MRCHGTRTGQAWGPVPRRGRGYAWKSRPSAPQTPPHSHAWGASTKRTGVRLRPALSLQGSRRGDPGALGYGGSSSSQVQTTGTWAGPRLPMHPHGNGWGTAAPGPYLRKVARLWQEAGGGGGGSVAGVHAGLTGKEGGGAHELAAGRWGQRVAVRTGAGATGPRTSSSVQATQLLGEAHMPASQDTVPCSRQARPGSSTGRS